MLVPTRPIPLCTRSHRLRAVAVVSVGRVRLGPERAVRGRERWFFLKFFFRVLVPTRPIPLCTRSPNSFHPFPGQQHGLDNSFAAYPDTCAAGPSPLVRRRPGHLDRRRPGHLDRRRPGQIVRHRPEHARTRSPLALVTSADNTSTRSPTAWTTRSPRIR